MRILSYVVLACWLAALVRTIVNLRLVPRLRPLAPKRLAPVSIIVPARDEERDIERAVRALLAQTYPSLEIIVVNDRSTDATGAILERIAREDPRLVVLNGEEPPEGWLGKPWAMHQGSRRARGELLLFVDADVIYEPDAVRCAVAHLESRDVSLLALLPRFEMRGLWEHVVMPNLAVFVFTYMPIWAVNRSRIPLLAIGGGTGNFVRRSDYEAAGGHESLKDAVVDDVGLARLIRRTGKPTEFALADHLISVRMYHGLSEMILGFTKNGFAILGRSYLAAAATLVFVVILNFLPIAMALTGDAAALATVALIVLSRVILFSALGYRLDNALLGYPLMVVTWCWILLRSVWYTGIRGQLLWRGRTYDAGRTRFGAD